MSDAGAGVTTSYKTMKADLSYQDPSKGNHYSGNESHLIEFTLCDTDFWLQ